MALNALAVEKRIRNAVTNLPPLPAVVTKLLKIVDNPETTIEEVQQLIATDPALTAKVLRLANSAYYGLARHVGTIQQAIIVLGLHAVKNLVLGLAAFQSLKGRKRAFLNEEQLWAHSFACATLAAEIARFEQLGGRQSEIIFMGGLLHDIGILFLSYHFPDEYRHVYERANSEGFRHEVEKEVLNIDHAEIGASIAHHWELPIALVRMIGDHHAPALLPDEYREMIACVALADAWLYGAGLGVDDRFAPPVPPAEAEQWANMEEATRTRLIEIMQARVSSVKQAINAA